jgi:hypothetical protein
MPSAGEVGSGWVSRWLGDLAGGRSRESRFPPASVRAGLRCSASAPFFSSHCENDHSPPIAATGRSGLFLLTCGPDGPWVRPR